ncbi:hypothetical protein PAPYR_9353 [Paratrimastix pyriformis]|uniref:F-box domain-containing protein n=1 Tax=Paratrimastix pyriformis TaxID=342808 RepID=A0ABQ8U8L6_9EUKA|nr:hypothetical protein PAPYR_9353 [Paratrimastix pyriformis]
MGACSSLGRRNVLISPQNEAPIGEGQMIIAIARLDNPQGPRIQLVSSFDHLPPEIILHIVEVSTSTIQTACTLLSLNHSLRTIMQRNLVALDFEIPPEIEDPMTVVWRPVPSAIALSALVGSCHSLKELALPSTRALTGSLTTPGWVDQTFGPHTSLRSLRLRSAAGFTQQTLCAIVGRLAALETLVLGDPNGAYETLVGWESLDPLLSTLAQGSCPQLRRLEIFTGGQTLLNFPLLVGACPLLEEIRLPPPNPTRAGLAEFLAGLPALRQVTLGDVGMGCLPDPGQISHHPDLSLISSMNPAIICGGSFAGLNRLKLRLEAGLSPPSAAQLAAGLLGCADTLQTLELRMLPEETAQPVLASVRQLKHLDTVDIRVLMQPKETEEEEEEAGDDGGDGGQNPGGDAGGHDGDGDGGQNPGGDAGGDHGDHDDPDEGEPPTDPLTSLLVHLLAGEVVSLRLQLTAPFLFRLPAGFVLRASARLHHLRMDWDHAGPLVLHAPCLESLLLPALARRHAVTTLSTPRLRRLENPPRGSPLVAELPMPHLATVFASEASGDPETPVGQLLASLPGLRHVRLDHLDLSRPDPPLLARPLDLLEINRACFGGGPANDNKQAVIELTTAVRALHFLADCPPDILRLTGPRLVALNAECCDPDPAVVALAHCPALTTVHASGMTSAGTLQDISLWYLTAPACAQLSAAMRAMPRLHRLRLESPKAAPDLVLASGSVQILNIFAPDCDGLRQVTIGMPRLEEVDLNAPHDLQHVHFDPRPVLAFVTAVASEPVVAELRAVAAPGAWVRLQPTQEMD